MGTPFPEIYYNNPTAQLFSSATSSDTTLTVQSSTFGTLMTQGQFRIMIDSEIMIVTQIAGTSGQTWTVTRGAEGTTAASHSALAAITQPITAGSIPLVANQAYHPGIRNIGKTGTSTAKGVTLAAGGTLTLLNITGQNPGYVNLIQIFLSGGGALAEHMSTIDIYIDGNSTPIGVAAQDLSSLCCGDQQPASFGNSSVVYNNYGYCFMLPIPYTTGIKIVLTNADSSNATTAWYCIQYAQGPINHFGRMQRFCTNTVRNTAVAAYATTTLLNTSGCGLFKGLFFRMINATDYHALEGEFKFYIDGESTPSFTSSGTEDYFMQPGYFLSGVFITEPVGCTLKTSPGTVAAYRFHLNDPIEFNTSIEVTWDCGVSSVATVTGTTDICTCAYYYLNQ